MTQGLTWLVQVTVIKTCCRVVKNNTGKENCRNIQLKFPALLVPGLKIWLRAAWDKSIPASQWLAVKLHFYRAVGTLDFFNDLIKISTLNFFAIDMS